MQILGIPIANITQKQFIHYVHDCIEFPGFHQVATVNPEFLLLALERGDFRRALLEADLRIADGMGIVFASALHGETLVERLPGADIIKAILTMAAAHSYSVFCAVRADGLSSWEEIRSTLEKKYPRIQVFGQTFTTDEWQTADLSLIRSDIVLCNFGIPEQELFLSRFKNIETPVRLAIGIGGAFDYLTSKARRAPRFWRAIGLEWLWRLIQEPRYRFKRAWNAVVVFPIRLLFGKIES